MKGDITLRFHEEEQNWEVIFEDGEANLHSNFSDNLDNAILSIFELIKMIS